MIYYNNNSDLNKEVNFIDVYLPCNKLSLQLIANNAITCSKKRYIDDVKNKATKTPKTNTTKEKMVSVK